MHVIWYTAMSMDGRIAADGDDLSFLSHIDATGEQDGEFEQFVSTLDAVIIGGSTLRWLVQQGHSWPHGELPTWLISRDEHLVHAVGEVDEPIHRREGPLGAVLEEIEAAGHERIWLCGGGDVAGQLLALDAIDEVIVTIAPTVLGSGPSLFDAPELPLFAFELAEVRRYGTQSARLTWRRTR